MPNKRKKTSRPHWKVKYANQKTRSERNKIRKAKKYRKEREDRKGTASEESQNVVCCKCQKTVQIRKYKGTNPYTCMECRVKAEPKKFKKEKKNGRRLETRNKKSK